MSLASSTLVAIQQAGAAVYAVDADPKQATQTYAARVAKLLHHLEAVLNTEEFRLIKQTASARSIGIPLGSVSAAIKNLLASGHLVAGSAGGFKLKRAHAAGVLV